MNDTHKEQTLLVIKPDGVAMGLEQDIVDFMLLGGLSVVKRLEILFDAIIFKKFYPKCDAPPAVFEKLILPFFLSGKSVVLLFQGSDAIAMGNRAKKHFRTKYQKNYYGAILHVSDDVQEKDRELEVIQRSFKKQGEENEDITNHS